MLMVCSNHVKDGLKNTNVPHVKKIKHYKYTCSFCHQEAIIKIFYSMPFYREDRCSLIKKFDQKELCVN